MFKVKATLISFAGDVERYPCHFGYEVGDEIIYDGENFIGRICLQIIPLLQVRPTPLFGRTPVRKPLLLFPLFLLASEHEGSRPEEVRRPWLQNREKRDNRAEIPYGKLQITKCLQMACPRQARHAKDLVGRCDDLRTAATFKFEAFDLCEKGDAVPYFRKQMLILKKVIEKPGIRADRIMDDMSRNHVEEIYPGLNPVLMEVLVEELAAIGFVTIRDSEVSATGPGEAKLREFTSSLTIEERKALELS